LRVGEIQEEVNEDEQDDEEMMMHEQKRRANKSASKENHILNITPNKYDNNAVNKS